MQHSPHFFFTRLSVCLGALLVFGVHDASAQSPSSGQATYKFNAYYADPVEASPSDLDVSPHRLADATDRTTSEGEATKESPNSSRSWKRYRLAGRGNSSFGSCNGYANFQLNFLSTNLTSKVDTNQSSDQLELLPRIVVGTRNYNQYGLRVRYQHYDWNAPSPTSPTPPGVRFKLDSLDLEATKRLRGCHTDLELAAGVRLARIQESGFLAESDSDLIGGTLAADGQTRLCRNSCWNWSWVYGGRLSLLGGHWNGTAHQGNGTVFASEIYTGLQCACCRRSHDLFARFLFEVQNWRSDAFLLSDNVTLMGPGVQLGVQF